MNPEARFEIPKEGAPMAKVAERDSSEPCWRCGKTAPLDLYMPESIRDAIKAGLDVPRIVPAAELCRECSGVTFVKFDTQASPIPEWMK